MATYVGLSIEIRQRGCRTRRCGFVVVLVSGRSNCGKVHGGSVKPALGRRGCQSTEYSRVQRHAGAVVLLLGFFLHRVRTAVVKDGDDDGGSTAFRAHAAGQRKPAWVSSPLTRAPITAQRPECTITARLPTHVFLRGPITSTVSSRKNVFFRDLKTWPTSGMRAASWCWTNDSTGPAFNGHGVPVRRGIGAPPTVGSTG